MYQRNLKWKVVEISFTELDPVMGETLISSHTEADLDQQPCIHMLGQHKLSLLYWNLYCSVAK